MPKPVLINLIEAFIAATPKEKLTDGKTFYYSWIKRIIGLDKSHDTGYSLLGKWVEKEDRLAWQRPGLYFVYAYEYVNLTKNNGSDRRVLAHLVSIFDFDSEGIAHLLHSYAYEKGDYAVHCWEVIGQWLLAHTKPKPLPVIEEGEVGRHQISESALTVGSAISSIVPKSTERSAAGDPKESAKQIALKDLMIRYAIEAQTDRKSRVLPREQVDITCIATKTFDWGTEYLFDVYRLDLSRELGVGWRLLPEVKLQGDWLEFHFHQSV